MPASHARNRLDALLVRCQHVHAAVPHLVALCSQHAVRRLNGVEALMRNVRTFDHYLAGFPGSRQEVAEAVDDGSC
jgi:hypothetical protein